MFCNHISTDVGNEKNRLIHQEEEVVKKSMDLKEGSRQMFSQRLLCVEKAACLFGIEIGHKRRS